VKWALLAAAVSLTLAVLSAVRGNLPALLMAVVAVIASVWLGVAARDERERQP
jgi:hypothetical protein